MRGPAEEGHEFLFFHRAGHFRQHRLLAGLDQFPLAHVEIVFLDDLLQRDVRRCTGADAVDLAVELVGVFVQVGKVMHTCIPYVIRNSEGEFGAVEVLRQLRDIAVGDELVIEALLRRHPVAEKHVHLAVLQTTEGDRHREGVDLGLVAHAVQQEPGDGVGRGDVAPSRVGHLHGLATLIGKRRCTAQSQEPDRQYCG
ncbi:hypothetical protein D3C78_943030 [compost metagenome]